MATPQYTDEALVIGEELPLLPIRNAVLFPGGVAPFDVGRPASLRLVEHIETLDPPVIAIFAQRKPETDNPGFDDLFPIGVAARVLKSLKHSAGNFSLILQGLIRLKLERVVSTEPFLVAQVTQLEEEQTDDIEVEALMMGLKDLANQVVGMAPDIPEDATRIIEDLEDPGQLADLVAANLDSTIDEKVELLGMLNVKVRLRGVLRLVTRQLELMKTKQRIDSQIKEEMGKSQREYVLRQQLKAIRDELGDEGDEEDELEALDERITKKEMPQEAEKVCRKQLRRLKSMQMGSAEYSVARTYLDWMLDLPWAEATKDVIDVPQVRRILDEDHYGLEKVKKRIVEYMAVRKLKPDQKGPILCFVGPPGVGKTSLGRSIARALDRKFVRISLGGVHDEAAIRGHRRTYVGALPGQIIQGLKKSGTNNPVFMMDEVDKVGRDFRGDPAAALLEVLDPEQNNEFSDHYIEVAFDLSNVMFITTANLTDPIPPALKDRMETLDLPGYTRREKIEIAKRHLVPKQLEQHGLDDTRLQLPDEVLEQVIDVYTREAGVRNLERNVAGIIRAIAVKIAEETVGEADYPIKVTVDDLNEFLGPPKHTSEMAERTEIPGVATGLVWTQVGGEIIFVEATKMKGKGALSLTGQLGDVMKESAQAALSYVRANAEQTGIDEDLFEKSDVHIHVPAGAQPKDGPSAGVAMFVSLVSLLSGARTRHDVAMTGEITLRGRVLPVGGVKEKVLAAHRAGIKRVIIPERNEPDLQEVPAEIREDLEFLLVGRMDQVLSHALERFPKPNQPQ
jgi:ATP-dependent Lon protease